MYRSYGAFRLYHSNATSVPFNAELFLDSTEPRNLQANAPQISALCLRVGLGVPAQSARRPSVGAVEGVSRHGCRDRHDGPGTARRGVPPQACRSRGNPQRSGGPRAGGGPKAGSQAEPHRYQCHHHHPHHHHHHPARSIWEPRLALARQRPPNLMEGLATNFHSTREVL
jgi:hypothetical protein